jgi:surface antigen
MRPKAGWTWLLAPLALGSTPPAAALPEMLLPAAYAGLEADDVALAAAAVQDALERAPSRHARRWRSGSSGTSGVITPLRTFRVSDGRYCRDYLEVIVQQGQVPASAMTTACRRADGTWEPVAP